MTVFSVFLNLQISVLHMNEVNAMSDVMFYCKQYLIDLIINN